MRSLVQAEHFSGVISLLEDCKNLDDGHGGTKLAQYFSEFNASWWWPMGRACRAQRQPGFILDAMNQALERVGQSGDESSLVEKLLDFGKFRYRFYDQDYEPIRLWEEALSRLNTAGTALRDVWTEERVDYTNSVAQLYFDIAVQNYKGE